MNQWLNAKVIASIPIFIAVNIAAFGAFHHKINIGVIFEAADIIDKRPREKAVLLQYAGDTKTIIIETNFGDIEIIG